MTLPCVVSKAVNRGWINDVPLHCIKVPSLQSKLLANCIMPVWGGVPDAKTSATHSAGERLGPRRVDAALPAPPGDRVPMFPQGCLRRTFQPLPASPGPGSPATRRLWELTPPAVQKYRTHGLKFAARGKWCPSKGPRVPGSQAGGKKHQVYQSAWAP